MAQTFHIRVGDTRPSLRGRLVDGNGTPVDLTGATAQLRYKSTSGGSLVTRTITIDPATAADGRFRYDWVSGDTAVTATCEYTIRVTYSDGSTESFPGQGYETFVVGPTLT